jgi:hypothetical protein
MASLGTITSLISGAVSFYYFQPYYIVAFKNVVFPTFNFVVQHIVNSKQHHDEMENEFEFYEVIKETNEEGIITRYLILKKGNDDDDTTMVSYEYENNAPVWL